MEKKTTEKQKVSVKNSSGNLEICYIPSGSPGKPGPGGRKTESDHRGLDGNRLHESAHGLHLRAAGALFLQHFKRDEDLRHQPDHRKTSKGHRLLRRALRKRRG